MTDQEDEKSLLILGDYTTDIFLYAEKWREEALYIREAPRPDYPFTLTEVPGGAGALAAYLEKAGVKVESEEYTPQPPRKCRESLYVLTKIQEKNGPVWRVDKSKAALPWGGDGPHESIRLDESRISPKKWLIVMDFDGGWREQEGDDKRKNSEKLATSVGDKPYLIRSHDPSHRDWKEFRENARGNGARPGIWVGVAEDLADGALRRPGIWTDYRETIVRYLKRDDTLFSKDKKPRGWQHVVVIRINYDGVFVLTPGPNKDGELFIFPGDQPGSFLRENAGHVVGGGIAFVASFVDVLKCDGYPTWARNNETITISTDWRKELSICAQKGLAQSRKVMETGYLDPAELRKQLRQSNKPTDRGLQDRDEPRHMGFHEISILKHVDPADETSVVQYTPLKEDGETACERIVSGTESEFRRRIRLRMGDLATADPDFARVLLELEWGLRRHAGSGKKVLSFAIFGEPGSGKSFVAESLQKAIDPKHEKFKLLPYNLSQFGGNRERLVDAFKIISQTSLQGKTPFVLWDEFDCALNGEKCGWLPKFLMPMEDAKFSEGKEVRQLGRCVFVFMGGIHEDEESFLQWIKDSADKAKLLKAPDFHSRLERTLQIPSVKLTAAGQKSIQTIDDAKITRAIFIRGFLGEDEYKNIEEIEPKVLAYLLHVTLRHGVRSLKKIIQASALDKTTTFGLLHLPSEDVLRSHVEEPRVKAFLKSLDGACELSEKPLELCWRSYQPKDAAPEADVLSAVEGLLGRCLAKGTYENVDQKSYEDFYRKFTEAPPPHPEYDELPPLEKDRREDDARSAIREKRGHRTGKDTEE